MASAATSLALYSVASVVVTAVFAYLYRLKGREYFLWWTWGWAFESVRAVAETVHEYSPTSGLGNAVAHPLSATSLVLSALLFLIGTRQLCGQKISWRPLGAAFALVVLWSLVNPLLPFHRLWTVTPGYLLSSVIMVSIGFSLLSSRKKHPVYGGGVLGALFLVWGFHLASYPLMRFLVELGPPWDLLWTYRFAVSSLLSFSVGIFMIVYVLEETGATLRETEERFRRIFLEASECILIADPVSGEILNANSRAQDLSGYTHRELKSLRIQDILFDPDTASPIGSDRWMPGGNYPKLAILDMQLRHREERFIPVSLTRTFLERDKENRLVLIHMRDETDSQRSRADRQIQFDRLRTLHQFSTALSKALDANRIYQLVFDHLRLILPLDIFSIDLYRPETNVLHTVFRSERTGQTYRHIATGPKRSPSRTLFETVIRDRQPVLENRGLSLETDASPLGHEITPSSSRPGSRMFVPMIASDEVLGILSVQSDSPGSYDSSMLDVFQNLANLTATALGNSHQFFREHEHSERMRFLKDLSASLTGSLELVSALERAQSLIAEFIHADRAAIHLYDAGTEKLMSPAALRRAAGSSSGPTYPARASTPVTPSAAFSVSAPATEPATPPASSEWLEEVPDLTLSCFATGQPVTENEYGTANTRVRPKVDDRPVKASAAVPLTLRGRPIGVLRVDDCRTAGRFERNEIEFLLLIAKQLTTAIETARNYEDLKKAKEYFSSLVEYSPTAVAVICEDRVAYANRSFRLLLDSDQEEFSPCPLTALLDAGDLPGFESHLERALRGHGEERCEVSLVRANGSRCFCEANLTLFPDQGSAVLGVFTDRTATASLSGGAKSAPSVPAVETLLTSVAGDFSAVFSGILGQTAYLKLLLQPGDRTTRSIESIEETALRASEYVKQILTLRETDPGDSDTTNLSGLVDNLLGDFAKIREGRFAYSLESEKDLHPARAPRSLFHLAFTGLLSAVVESFPIRGPLAVELRNREWTAELDNQLHGLPKGGFVEIRLAAREGGVSTEGWTRLMRPAESSDPGSPGGPIGLPLSLGLFRLMGARVVIARMSDDTAALSLLLPTVSGNEPLPREGAESRESPLPLETSTPTGYESSREVVVLSEEELP